MQLCKLCSKGTKIYSHVLAYLWHGSRSPLPRHRLQAIMEAAELKKQGRVKKVVVTGCLAQRYGDELAGDCLLLTAGQVVPSHTAGIHREYIPGV